MNNELILIIKLLFNRILNSRKNIAGKEFYKSFRAILTFKKTTIKTFQNLMNNQEISSFKLFKLTVVRICMFLCLCSLHYRGRKRFVSEGDGGRLKPESY